MTWLAVAVLAGVGLPGGAAQAEGGLPELVVPSSENIAGNPRAAHEALGLIPGWMVPVSALEENDPIPEPMRSDVSDLRFVLTQLAILAGANDHLFLLEAQAASDALVVVGGEADLATLAAAHPRILQPDGAGGWRLTRPLVIWQGARLRLGTGDRLALSTVDGAFLLVFGQLDVTGATLEATDDTNPRSPDFRPFLLSAGAAELRMSRANVSGLGMTGRGLFGGVTHISSGLIPPSTAPSIRDSQFHDIGRLSLRQTTDSVIAGNRFSAGGGIEIVGGARLAVIDNLLEDTASSFAIRLSGAVTDSLVLGSTILRAKGTGLSITGLSQRIVVGDTLIDQAAGDGVSVDRASCLRFDGLALLRGYSVGLRIRASGRISVNNGAIIDNRTTGVAIHDQPSDAALHLADLTIAGNAVGIKGWGTTEVDLHDIALKDQMPQLFAGDLAPFTGAYLKSSQQLDETDFAMRLGYPKPPASLVPASFSITAIKTLLPDGVQPWDPACEGG